MDKYDAIIIGTGQGGTPLAKKLAKHGWKTAIIEKANPGGTCINTGCTPTKTLVASAKAAHTIANASAWGIEVKDYHIDIKKVLERKNKIVEQFRGGVRKGIAKTNNLTFIEGTAFFTANNTLSVKVKEGELIEIFADKIFINTGASPSIPPIEGIDKTKYYTSASLMELEEIPQHLIIIGSGYIGLEFSQLYKRLGSKVTLLEKGGRILKKEDEDVATELEKILSAEGIVIEKNIRINRVEEKNNKVLVHCTRDNKPVIIEGTHLLIAAGRKPCTEELHLDIAGVKVDDKGFIQTDEKLKTSVENIYALGDVKGGPQFTHVSYNDYLILYHNLVSGEERTIESRIVPYCIFMDPQLGRVGITEQEAIEKNIPHKVAKIPGNYIARGLETGHTQGLMKAVVHAEDERVLGVAIIGEEGGEVMSILQMAMVGNIKWTQLREMIFAHPLYAESINNLFMQFDEV